MSMFYELMMRKKEETMYATIKGTLTENDGVFSGFSASNYLEIPNISTYTQDDRYEVVFKFNLTNLSDSTLCGGLGVFVVPVINFLGNIRYFGSAIGLTGQAGTNTLVVGQDYWFKAIYDTSSFKGYISTDGTNWVLDYSKSVSVTFSRTGPLQIGRNTNVAGQYMKGTIDLNNSYIKLGSTKYNLQAVVGYTVVGSPTITDGVVSGFSSANYLNLNQIYNAKNIMNTEIYIRAKTPSSFSSGFSYIFSNTSGYNSVFSLAVSSGVAFTSFMGSNLAGTTLAFSDIYISGNAQNNTWYRFKIKGNNGLWVFEVYDDNGNLLGRNTKDWTNLSLDQNYRIKLICLAGVNSGEIDLNETYIKVNNKLWFNGQQA